MVGGADDAAMRRDEKLGRGLKEEGGANGSPHLVVEEEDGADRKDAGALFVLKSKGSWQHCGCHMTTAIVAPALLSLPSAMATLGWTAGVFSLVVGGTVTFYNYNLISLVLERRAATGRRLLRFRNVADDIFGSGWGKLFVGPVQLASCIGAVIGCALLGGTSIKSIYLVLRPDGALELYKLVVAFGFLLLLLAQIPSFHSLRHINLLSLLLCLSYSACAAAGSIHAGDSPLNPPKDYAVLSAGAADRVFGVFNSISIIATTYGNGILPEIQATVAPPVMGKMFKGLCLCYTIVVSTFFSVAISGYWAFGNRSKGVVLSNFIIDNGATFLVPKWFLVMTNAFTLLQASAVGVVYMQPTNEVLEACFGDPKRAMYSLRNQAPRVVLRSAAVAVATLLAAMLPFFGDINALLGALGYLPLDFVVPAVFYNVAFKPSKRSLVFWINAAVAAVFSVCTVMGSVAAVRQIVLDAKAYKLFANT